MIICQVITPCVAKSLQTASSIEVRFPHAARHMPRCSTLHHHSPKLQVKSQGKKGIHGKADRISSEHSTRIPVIDVGGEPDGHFVPRYSTGGASFHRPLAKKVGGGAGWDGSEPCEPAQIFWLSFLGLLGFHDLKIFVPRQKP